MAITPVSKIVNEIKDINLSKLSKRLDEGNKKNEIEQLAVNFNQMLSDLEVAFKSQEEFVSNASHELRSPLAIMIARSEYILSRDRSNEEYKQQMSELKINLRNLNNLLNSLLELAHINRENSIVFTKIWIDEVIFNTVRDVKQKYPGRKIIPKVEYSDDECDLLINGNQGFLEIALKI
jgi:signal transduction histidine kinase